MRKFMSVHRDYYSMQGIIARRGYLWIVESKILQVLF